MAEIEEQTAASAAGARLWIGSLVALCSAVTFALNMVLARVTYDAGGNIHALNLSRAGLFLLCLGAWVHFSGRSLKLPRGPLLASLLLGLLLCAEMYLLLGAIIFIPVALTILIMYSYPLLLAGLTWVTGSDKPTLPRVLALVVAFMGLGIAVAAPVGGVMDWRGIGLAGASALTLGALLLFSERIMEGRDNRVIMFYMIVATTMTVALLSATVVDLAWPSGTKGWLAFCGSTAFYVVATVCLFTAVSMIGPLKTAAIDNTSPVWALLFGFGLIGETLAPRQMLGMALVVGALIFLQIVQRPRRPLHG
jgi:drug/metabolite transporter (DMT)-like permease